MIHFFRDRLIGIRAGRRWDLRDAWSIWLMFLPRVDLMTRPGDEGRHVLAVLFAELTLFRSRQAWLEGRGRWRILFASWSDADEITNRVAGLG